MPDTRQYFWKLTDTAGTTYYVKDEEARELISDLQKYSKYLGVTTTELEDGVTTSATITIAGQSVTAKTGDIANYGSKEFIYNGTVWQEFGDLSAIGALGYADTATGSGTPAGTISGTNVSYSPSSATVNSITAVGTLPSISVVDGALTFSQGTLPTKGSDQTVLTALGDPTVTQGTFSGSSMSITVSPDSGT